jgi:hypothetical protein
LHPQKLLVSLLAVLDSNIWDTNMALTDVGIRGAKPADRLIKASNGGGLQLCVTPYGAKRWRLAYRFGGLLRAFTDKIEEGDLNRQRPRSRFRAHWAPSIAPYIVPEAD